MAENKQVTVKRTHFFDKSGKRNNRSEKFKKFIGNKSEGQGFADKRKKKIQYEYLKTLQKERKTQGQRKTVDYTSDETSASEHSKKWKGKGRFKKEVNRFSKVTKEAQNRKEIKRKKKEEALKRKQEKDEALQKYSQRKKANFKKLCKKTHKGQPVMKNQIEVLLQKIEKQINQT